MQKKTLIKLGGFIAAAAATASLVGFAANGTGAYFSDSHSGTINAGTGNLSVTVSPSNGQLNFTNLMPGEYQTASIGYTAHTTASSGEDVWLVLTPPGVNGDGNTCAHDTAEALNGRPDDGCGGGLGRYGHFAITSTAFGAYGGAGFTSYNLSTTGTTVDNSVSPPVSHIGPTCAPVDANGNGGSSQVATSVNDHTVAFCPVPNAILLAYGLTDGNDGTATVTFGFTPLLMNPENGPTSLVATYKIIATQHNVSPTDPNNQP